MGIRTEKDKLQRYSNRLRSQYWRNCINNPKPITSHWRLTHLFTYFILSILIIIYQQNQDYTSGCSLIKESFSNYSFALLSSPFWKNIMIPPKAKNELQNKTELKAEFCCDCWSPSPNPNKFWAITTKTIPKICPPVIKNPEICA